MLYTFQAPGEPKDEDVIMTVGCIVGAGGRAGRTIV